MPTQTCVARDSLLFYPKRFFSMIILQPSSGVGRQFCTCSVILGQIYKPRGFCWLVQSLLTSVETPLISSEHRMSGSNLLQPCEPVSGLCQGSIRVCGHCFQPRASWSSQMGPPGTPADVTTARCTAPYCFSPAQLLKQCPLQGGLMKHCQQIHQNVTLCFPRGTL